jgi:hypothetical protein
MSEPSSPAIGMDALSVALRADLAQHCGFGDKVSGGSGDAATAQWISSRMLALGFSVERQEIEVPFFEPAVCRLTAGDAAAPLYWQSPVTPTGPEGLTAPLAVVRAPFESSAAAGCIALLMLPYARHASIDSPLIAPLLDSVVAAGARAAVLVPVGPSGQVVALNCPVCPRELLPTAVLAPVDAEPFLRAAHRGTVATLVLHGAASRRPTSNLHGALRRGPQWLCLSTPRTGWFTCASERGTGTAAFLAIAAWVVKRFPELSVFFLNTGAHEYLFAGAHHSLRFAPAPEHTAAWVHLGASLAAPDRLELRGHSVELPSADANRTTMATDALHTAASKAFHGIAGLEMVMPPLPGVSELGAIVARGYDRAFAVLGVPRMFHTRLDDRPVDVRLLRPVVRAHMAVIESAVRSQAAGNGGVPA